MNSNKKNIIIIFLVSVLIMLPLLLNKDYPISDDSDFHIANIYSTIDTMDDFIPDDILPNLFGNYGVGVRQFYPVLGHTFVAYFSKITGINVMMSLKITHTIVLFLSGLTLYYFALHLCKNKRYALFSSIVYMLFPYHLSEIYVRDALGESLLFIFLPMILNGLSYLFEDKKKFYLLFCLGYIGGMLSHLTLMVYFTVLIIPFFIINYKKVFTKETIKSLFIAAFIILGIMSPVIVNMFQNKLGGDYRVFTPYVMAQNIQHNGLWYQYLTYFQFLDPLLTSESEVRFFVDIIVLILLFLLWKKRKNIDFSSYRFIIVFSILCFCLSFITFPWDFLPVSFRLIQFPWRLEGFLAIGISLLVPLALPYLKIKFKPAVLLIILFAMLSVVSIKHKENINPTWIKYYRGLGWQFEYLPNKTYGNWDNIEEQGYKVITSNGEAKIIEDSFPNIKFEVSEDANVEIPRIFYFGYTLYDENNNEVEIYDDDKGLIGANLNKGTYTLKYTQTKLVRIANIISIVFIIIFGFIILKLYNKDKKR